jgi:hypothetical protein
MSLYLDDFYPVCCLPLSEDSVEMDATESRRPSVLPLIGIQTSPYMKTSDERILSNDWKHWFLEHCESVINAEILTWPVAVVFKILRDAK